MKLRDCYYFPAYYVALLIFAVGGLEVSALGLLFGWLPATPRTERIFQRYIHYHFRLFHEWCKLTDLIHVRYRGMEKIPAVGGVVLVANHLSLIDITCLLAWIPEAACIFKPSIRRNPVLGAAARRAGYLASDGGHGLIRHAIATVASGQALVVFPEGTRAPGGRLLPFKPGFALIARAAAAPVQLVRIGNDSNVLTKGEPMFRLPRFPAHVTISVGPAVEPADYASPEDLTAAVENWYRTGRLTAPACAAIPAAVS